MADNPPPVSTPETAAPAANSRFVHLHVHSHYSLLNALPKIPDLVSHAKAQGMEYVALTDNGNLYGAVEFYKECQKQGVKPILGIDGYLAIRTRHDKEPRIDNKWHRIVLLAQNHEGYKNLIKLVTTSHLEGFYYKPRLDKELLERHKDHLVCILPSFSSEVSSALKNNDDKHAHECLNYYKHLYGVENVYIEITHHPEMEGHQDLMKKLLSFARETKTPVVAGHDVYYLKPDDKQARVTLLSIQSSDPGEARFGSAGEFEFISSAQAEEYFKDIPDAIDNTKVIAARCALKLELGKWLFPNYIVPEGKTHDDVLRDVVYEGLKRRNVELTDQASQRIEYELKVIKDKGYAPYFLVVYDLLRYAHENHILTNIRGSVAGSMVTYLAGITNVNPLEYKLPFERFLNPERPSAPDIDMDYADNRRDEMIEYARRTYGHDKVAQIGTFGTMMARGAVRDVARALGFPYAVGDNIAKLIPMGSQGFPMTIDHAIETTPELQELYKKDEEARSVIDMAKKIEGCARHISVHAAGVVISPIPLNEIVPLQLDTKEGGKIITQYDMHSVDENSAGLLKFDFLGIKNLAILADAVALVKKIEGIEIDIENVPIDDKKTFAMLARGETVGLFQLNGSGMTRFLKELKPTTIHDINAMVALYRPGPLESIPQYIERKHNPMLVRYLDPRMKNILDQSYGVITYQDDVMLIAIHLGGYSWLEADKLRKAMGKKIPAEMEAQKEKLRKGLIQNGMSQEKADELWKLIEPFAAYGFNKAHAASYGRVAYQTGYMKANFPAIYMSAVLTADSGDVEKIAEFIAECKRMKIDVLPPDINESFSGFTVVKKDNDADKIRFGLTTIKNFGEGIADSIIAERKKGGPFTSLSNFFERIKDRNLNKKSVESLIKAGALDMFGERGALLYNLETLLTFNKEHRGSTSQDSLFGDIKTSLFDLKLAPAPAATTEEKLVWEKELLGLYISGHPLDKYHEKLAKVEMNIKQIKENLREGMTAIVYGMLEEVRPIVTKKGDKMFFIKIGDYTGNLEGVIFPKLAQEHGTLITPDNCVALKGRLSMRNGVLNIAVEKMKAL